MNKKLFVPILMMIICFSFACKQNASHVSDSDLVSAVKVKLHSDPKLAASDINVKSDNSIVKLDGKVTSADDEKRAVHLASSVPGVTRVESELKIDNTITNDEIKDRVKEDDRAAKKEMEAQTPDSKHPMDDAAITAKVKMTLAEDHLLSAFNINVDTKNQVVTLTGTVKNELAARHAVQVAQAVDGVKSVNSVLTVKQ